jgi:predicted DNA-binding transcriptional regulator AlpA
VPDYTIPEWCEKRRICRATFYNLQKRGDGPRTIKIGYQKRITAEDDAEWVARMRAEAAAEKAA